jgi:hypothetical protein
MAFLFAKPTPRNVNHDNDRFSMFNKERDIPRVLVGCAFAIGQGWVGCRGCYRIMAPLVEPFRRTTCCPACAIRVKRRRVSKP